MVISKIPFLNLKQQYLNIKDDIDHAMQQVINEAAFAGGKFVASFEDAFAAYQNTNYCAGVNSGTSSLHLSLLALGIGAGDEVIIPANSFIATAWAVSYTGATPVFADCDAYYNIDPTHVKTLITKKTKAVIGVHLYGQPFNVEDLLQTTEQHGLYLVEDAAQAHGAYWKGEPIGSFGALSCFSFYPSKNLGAFGESGAICCNDKKYYDAILKLRNHGSLEKYQHERIGYNMRMDGLQAAILEIKLHHLEKWNYSRRYIARRYQEGIQHSVVQKPKIREQATSVFHLYVITVPDRDHFVKHLETCGISCGMHYPIPCHLQEAYRHLNYKKGSLPNTEFLAAHCVSLPIFPELHEEEIDYIIEAINQYKR